MEKPAFEPALSAWERLSAAKKPIVMYGMGDGAEKILRVMESMNIRPAEFMASDEFVRGHSFHGYVVKKLSEIRAQYDDFIIVICFGTALSEVLEKITRLSEQYEVIAPDVPVVGGGLFDKAYLLSHMEQVQALRAMLADDKSRFVLDALIKYRITGDISVLRGCETDKDEALGLLNIGEEETYVDLGAYNGDTVEEFLRLSGGKFKKIYALEPDKRSYSKLCRRHLALDPTAFVPINAAAWSKNETLIFHRRAGRNSSLTDTASEKTAGTPVEIQGVSVDGLLGAEAATVIKYDVEGSEKQALLGSAEALRRYKPRLIVSLYHRTEDMTELPLLIKELNPAYKMYLRHHPYIPAWDTNLYCV